MLPLASFAQSVSPSPSTSMQNPYDSCSSRWLLFHFDVRRFGEPISQLPIWHGMRIDEAPNAYKADNTGLDDLSNAAEPGHRDGVLQDEAGNPLVQACDDPAPPSAGYPMSLHQPAPSEPQASQPAEAPAPEAKPATDVCTTTHAHTP